MDQKNACSVCLKEGAEPDGLCVKCRGTLGLEAGLPREPLRDPGPCRRCGGLTLLEALMRERTVALERERIVPIAVAFTAQREQDWIGRPTAAVGSPAGALVAYVCMACGFTELYTSGAARLPIGGCHGTRLLEYGSDGPYRGASPRHK